MSTYRFKVNQPMFRLFFMLILLVQAAIPAFTQEQQRQATPAIVNPVLRSNLSQTISLDGTWDFAIDPEKIGQEKQWYLPDVELPNKRDIQVPGCWEAQGVGQPGRSNEGTAGFETYGHMMFTNYGGAAWYRKTVKVPAMWQDNKIWLKIGGINSVGWIWVNGTFVAKHYEYAGTYKYDITDLVTTGKSTTVAILVRNDIPSRQGEVNSLRVLGGLHRSVELEATGDVFVEYASLPDFTEVKILQSQSQVGELALAFTGRCGAFHQNQGLR